MEKQLNPLVILHFNDVYTIEEAKEEPVGGIARFKTALNSFSNENPLVLFSGDLFSPSTLTNITNGEHMITPVNEFKVDVACLGNHDFDLDVEILSSHIKKCNFPWLLSNVVDPRTQKPFGGGQEYHILYRQGLKIGFIGLAEYDWLVLLRFPSDHLIYEDFVDCAKRLTKFLREEQGCDMVIALTHMRTHNDEKLAESFTGLDLILGGHDHVRHVGKVNGTYIIKSGCEFREFSKITLTPIMNDHEMNVNKENIYKDRFLFDIEHIEITKKWKPDPVLEKHVELYSKIFEEKMGHEIGCTDVDLDTRFSKIRTSEQNASNFIADVIRAYSGTDVVILNTGTIRSDCIIPKGILKLKHLKAMIPHSDLVRKVQLTGAQLHKTLENGVSRYPAYEGRFPAVSGIKFSFNPNNPPMQRIPIESIVIEGRGQLDPEAKYTLAVRNYLAKGKDGYEEIPKGVFLNEENTSDDILNMLIRFFELVNIPELRSELKSEGSSIDREKLQEILIRVCRLKGIPPVYHLVNDVKYVDDKHFISINPKIEDRIKNLCI